MSQEVGALRGLVKPLLAPDGWLEPALRRLDADPFAARVPAVERVALARAAWAAGVGMARAARGRGWPSAEAALARCGVAVQECDDDPSSGPFVHHAVYAAPPPRVTLYRRLLEALEPLLDAAELRRELGAITVKEIVLAHELCHHLVQEDGGPPAVSPHVVTFALGRWRRRAVVRAAEEVAAGGFAAAWCDVEWAPAAVDALTEIACSGAVGACLPRSPWMSTGAIR